MVQKQERTIYNRIKKGLFCKYNFRNNTIPRYSHYKLRLADSKGIKLAKSLQLQNPALFADLMFTGLGVGGKTINGFQNRFYTVYIRMRREQQGVWGGGVLPSPQILNSPVELLNPIYVIRFPPPPNNTLKTLSLRHCDVEHQNVEMFPGYTKMFKCFLGIAKC